MALSRYDDLLMVLAPYLHGERYSSYGRHFTSKRLLHHVAERWVCWHCCCCGARRLQVVSFLLAMLLLPSRAVLCV